MIACLTGILGTVLPILPGHLLIGAAILFQGCQPATTSSPPSASGMLKIVCTVGMVTDIVFGAPGGAEAYMARGEDVYVVVTVPFAVAAGGGAIHISAIATQVGLHIALVGAQIHRP